MKIRLFDARDRTILAGLTHDPDLGPIFDPLRHCLTWADEYSPDLSSAGHEILYDLWIARSYVHSGESFHSRPLGGDYYEAFWEAATQSDIPWNGFRRLKLNREDRNFLQHMATVAEQNEDVL